MPVTSGVEAQAAIEFDGRGPGDDTPGRSTAERDLSLDQGSCRHRDQERVADLFVSHADQDRASTAALDAP